MKPPPVMMHVFDSWAASCEYDALCFEPEAANSQPPMRIEADKIAECITVVNRDRDHAIH